MGAASRVLTPVYRFQSAMCRIAVRPAASFPGLVDGYVRVAVCRADENARLLAAFEELAQ